MTLVFSIWRSEKLLRLLQRWAVYLSARFDLQRRQHCAAGRRGSSLGIDVLACVVRDRPRWPLCSTVPLRPRSRMISRVGLHHDSNEYAISAKPTQTIGENICLEAEAAGSQERSYHRRSPALKANSSVRSNARRDGSSCGICLPYFAWTGMPCQRLIIRRNGSTTTDPRALGDAF